VIEKYGAKHSGMECKMKERKHKMKDWWSSLDNRKRLYVKLGCSVALFLFALIFFMVNKDCFYGLDGQGQPSLLKKKTCVYFGFFVLYIASIYVKNPLGKMGNRILNIHLMEWFPLICFFVVEMALGTDLFQMNGYRLLINVILYLFVLLFFFAIAGSIRWALIGVAAFSALFAIANVYLMEFRQIPLLASDFSVIRTALNVAGDFTYRLNSDVILVICFLVAVIVLAGKLKDTRMSKRAHLCVAVLYLIFAAATARYMVFTDSLKAHHININTHRPSKSYSINGGLLTFTRSMRLMLVEKPEGYGEDAVEEITKDYTSDSVSDTDTVKPNVIVIMDEAFSDLQSVGSFETNEEVLPFYNSMSENTVKGYAYVSVFGGQTANSEFEFLTGDSKAFLPSGSTPYQFYVKQYLPSLTGNLKLDGYQGLLAMHPYLSSGYNRVSVYQNFGFSRFITVDDFENPTLVRNFVSDETDFDRIISEYEAAKAESDEPFYLFNVTMQNHSAYDTDFDNLPKDIEITTPECKDEAAERYLNLIHLSDAAAEKLVTYFEQQEEPTVIVMFGDHEPGLSDSFYESILGRDLNSLTNEENMELYKVPFFIWANYDIEEQYIEKTSLNYLQSIMLDVAGMKKTGYNKFLLDIMEEIPAVNVSGYFGADGAYYDNTDTTSPYYETLRKYNVLEYNHLFDSKRKNEFFEYRK
jgi:phosphoglycerol transferase MdoB-like AlkP superfamily enzyme